MPSILFTIPPVAMVGMDERTADERGFLYRVNTGDASTWYSSRRLGGTIAGYKVLIENETDHIFGAHVLGPHADEIINVFALAIRAGVTAMELAETIFAYPTGASEITYML